MVCFSTCTAWHDHKGLQGETVLSTWLQTKKTKKCPGLYTAKEHQSGLGLAPAGHLLRLGSATTLCSKLTLKHRVHGGNCQHPLPTLPYLQGPACGDSQGLEDNLRALGHNPGDSLTGWPLEEEAWCHTLSGTQPVCRRGVPRRNKLAIVYKKPAYGRQRISRPMRIVGPLQSWRGCMIYL